MVSKKNNITVTSNG